MAEEQSEGIVGFTAVLVDRTDYRGLPPYIRPPLFRAGLEALYIRESWQGQGLGTMLLRASCETLLGMGIENLETWVFTGHGAAQWYWRLGAKLRDTEIVWVGSTRLERLNLAWGDLRTLIARARSYGHGMGTPSTPSSRPGRERDQR